MALSSNSEMRTLDPVLTTLAQGYSNKKYVADYLFPVVEVSKSKGRIPLFGKSAFLERKVDRAMGSNSNRIPITEFDLCEYNCTEKDVEMAVDYLEEENSNDFYKFERRSTIELCDILELGRELETAAIALDEDNYADNSKLILDDNTAFNGTSGDATTILHSCIEAVRMNIGLLPNTMIIDSRTFRYLMEESNIREKIKYSGIKALSENMLSEMLGIETVKIASAVYTENGSDFVDVWGNNIILAYVDRSDKRDRSELNPSFGYTLRRKGMPEIDVYYETGGKVKVIRNTDNYCIRMTSPDAAFLIANTLTNLATIED